MQTTNRTARELAARYRGVTVLEMVAAAAILGVLLIMCAQMLGRMAVQQQTVTNRRAAVQMASNAMERIYALPWNRLDCDTAAPIAQTIADQGMLRGARVVIAVDRSETTLPAKKVQVRVVWSEGTDDVERSQLLTAWRYRPSPIAGVSDGASASELQPEQEDE